VKVDSNEEEAMPEGTLRKVQPAHKSDKFTVREARNAWLKVESETRSPALSGETGDVQYGTHRTRRARKKNEG
jgi:hypothetical protein